MSEISLDAYKTMVGKEVGVSRWFEVPQERIDSFADVTEDHPFIHVDPERAKATPFGFVLKEVVDRGPKEIMAKTEVTVEIEGAEKPALPTARSRSSYANRARLPAWSPW